MYVFKCNDREIGVRIEEMDCLNHIISICVIPNLDDLHDNFELRFINERSFVRFKNADHFEYVPEMTDVLSSVDISMDTAWCHPPFSSDDLVRDKNMIALVSFLQSLRDATKV